jgi:hypothetical protein
MPHSSSPLTKTDPLVLTESDPGQEREEGYGGQSGGRAGGAAQRGDPGYQPAGLDRVGGVRLSPPR